MASSDSSLFAYNDSGDDDRKKEKSPNALRTISEASEMLDVPQHVLRFWETKFSHIKPLKRNGGRRFYRPQDLEVLQQIKHLLYNQGYTIKGAKKAIDDFAHARSAGDTPTLDWLATVPPANVNDNSAVAAPEPETEALAEIAQALSDIDVDSRPAHWREMLGALRAELAATREELAEYLPKAA